MRKILLISATAKKKKELKVLVLTQFHVSKGNTSNLSTNLFTLFVNSWSNIKCVFH